MTVIEHLLEALLEKIWNDPWLFLEFALTDEEIANDSAS